MEIDFDKYSRTLIVFTDGEKYKLGIAAIKFIANASLSSITELREKLNKPPERYWGEQEKLVDSK